MTWSFSFYYSEEDGMTTDPANYEANVSEDEYRSIQSAVDGGRKLKEEGSLQKLQWRVFDEIRKMLVEDMKRGGDEYTLLCLQNNADPFDYAYTLHVDIFDPSDSEYGDGGSYFL